MALPVIHQDGFQRVMACLPPRPDFGGLPRFSLARVVPESSWSEVDWSPLGVPVMDQGNHGSCVGHGSVSAFWFAYLMAGGTVPDSGFSPTSLYALINGGRDQGAIVSDAMDALMKAGVCTMAECPETVIYTSHIPSSADATRKRFRVEEAYHCGNFDEIGSALQLGFPVSFGISLPNNFQTIGADGIAPMPRGFSIGGHCMMAYGTTQINGRWYLRVRNSWGTRWGNAGNCCLSKEWFPGSTDAFAVQAAISDPMDPNPFPVAPV